MTEDEAFRFLCEVRFPRSEGISCPHCKGASIKYVENRLRFRCRSCERDFSPTSGTVWAGSKLPIKTILRITAQFSLAAFGFAAEELARHEGLSTLSASLILRKLREAMASDSADKILSGDVQFDTAVFGNYVRKANYVGMRADQRKTTKPRRKVLGAVRETGGRVLIKVLNATSAEEDFLEFIRKRVDTSASLTADDASSWKKLGNRFAVMNVVNHAYMYGRRDGVTNNSVERFFSRCRSAERGVYINLAGNSFDLFMEEIAFRETHSKLEPWDLFLLVLSLSLNCPPSRRLKGYHQGNRSPANDNNP